MWRRLTFAFILTSATIGFLSCDESVSEERKKEIKIIQKTMWETSQFFHRWNIGLSQSKLRTPIEGQLMRNRLGGLSKFTAMAAGFCGSLGAVFALTMVFIPPQSPELLQINRTYNVMNERLDSISSSISDLNSMIKTAIQRSTFIEHENAIKLGNEKLTEYIIDVSQITCQVEEDCLRGLVRVAERYESFFDVEGNVRAIARGATENGVFGKALLDLYKDSSKCNLPGINRLASGIAVLIFRGMILVSIKGRLTVPDYSPSKDTRYLTTALEKLEKKRQEIEESCLKDIDLIIKRDLKQKRSILTTDTQITNEALLNFLGSKYIWIDWYVTSFVSDSKPGMWGKPSALGFFHVKTKRNNVNVIAWPIIRGSVSMKQLKINTTKLLYSRSGTNIDTIVQNVRSYLFLKNQMSSIASLKSAGQLVMSYYDSDGTMRHIYETGNDRNPMLFRSLKEFDTYLLVYFKRTEPLACTTDCHGNGKCIIYPHSEQSYCKCKRNFYGEFCNVTKQAEQLKLDTENLLSKTLTVPSISTLKFMLEDSRRMLQLSFENVTEAFTEIKKIIRKELSDLSKSIAQQFQWHSTLTLYRESMESIRNLASFYQDNIDFSRWNMTVLSTVLGNVPVERTGCEKSREIISLLNPLKLRKWINDINYLIVGRYNDFFSSHKPLLFMLMDRYKDRLCYPDYKATIDNAYHQLITLQLQGFLLWDMVLVFFNLDSSAVLEKYGKVIDKQSKKLKEMTCTLNISNSKNFQSCNGIYLHRNMDVEIECTENFYPKEQNRFWVNEVTGFSSEYSSNGGSARKIIGHPDVYSDYKFAGNSWTQNVSTLTQHQHIKVKFAESVFAEEIRIYEVFNAGAVTRISAKFPSGRFAKIWSTSAAKSIRKSRIFSPYFKPLPFPVDEIRLLVDPYEAAKAYGFFAIDAIMIVGKPLRIDERFIWNTTIGWTEMQSQEQKSITINLTEYLYIKNVTVYEPTINTVIGIQAYFDPGYWETISLNDKMANRERNLYFTPALKFPEQKTNRIRVISYGIGDHSADTFPSISILGLKRLHGERCGPTGLVFYHFKELYTCAKLNASSCLPCECDSNGSGSPNCDASGQCQCSGNYYGKRCNVHDCEVDQWTSWTNCPCSVRNVTQSRSRNITSDVYGNGRPCPSLQEIRNCTFMECQCSYGYYGENCTNRDCALGDWTAWNRVCPGTCKDNHGRQHRTRNVVVSRKGSGRPCGRKTDSNLCPRVKCNRVCKAFNLKLCEELPGEL